jgi:hypothetical protein
MKAIRSIVRRSTLALVVASLTGCAGMGLGQTLGGLGLPGSRSQLRGQVRYVDGRARVIQLESSRGQNVTLDYDSRTEVVFQNRRYSPSSLERGDYVTARIRRDNRRRAYADRIIVERSVRDSRGGRDNRGDDGRYERGARRSFDGRVTRIDYQRGYFQMQESRGEDFTVAMPYNPRDADLQRFRRLRNGDRVRFDGVVVSRDRVELNRFR